MKTNNRPPSTGRAGYPCFLIALLLVYISCTKKVTESIAVPSITSVSSTLLKVGDTLTITGGPFSQSLNDNLVSIAAVAMPVIKASSTELSVVVPNNARSGQLTVAFASGRPGTYKEEIAIIVAGQPVIASITPASADNGDTIVIRGNSFAVPSSNNSVLFSGIKGAILNATDSIIRVVVPNLAYTGPVTITSGGLSSIPYKYTINKVNPLEDGRLYWVYAEYAYQNDYPNGYVNFSVSIQKGKDSNGPSPFGTEVYGINESQYPIPDMYSPSAFDAHINNGVVTDKQGNAYYLAVRSDVSIPQTLGYQLVKMTLTGGSFSRSVIWSMDPANEGVTVNPDPSSPSSYPVQVLNNPLTTLGMDGNKLYIKLGASNDYYTADVSVATPVFTLERNTLTDSCSLGPQFGKDYIFYPRIGAGQWGGMGLTISKVTYIQRGASVSQDIAIDPSETILSTMADPSHGDTIIICTMTNQPVNKGVRIYRFVAATQQLITLYDPSTWKDGNFSLSRDRNTVTGFLWAGQHIYYANKGHSDYSNNLGDFTSTGIYRLNDDGSTTKPPTVYGRIEAGAKNPGPFVDLFMGPVN